MAQAAETYRHITARLIAIAKGAADWLKYYVWGALERADRHHLMLNAGGLTFSILVCIIPLILIVFTILGFLFSGPQVATEVSSFIDRLIPYEQYAGLAKKLVLGMVEEFRLHRSTSGLIGALGMILAASGLFGSMRAVLNIAFRVRGTRWVLHGKLKDLLMMLVVISLFMVSITAIPMWELAIESARKFGLPDALKIPGMSDFIMGLASYAFLYISFLVVYWLVPSQRQPARVYLLSALVATLLWLLAKELFGVYIARVATFNRVYGAYAFLVVIGFWIYYTGIVLGVGAEVGQLYKERREGKVPETTWS